MAKKTATKKTVTKAKKTNNVTKKSVNNKSPKKIISNKKNIEKKEVVSDNLLIDKNYKKAEKLYKNNEFQEAYKIYFSLLEEYNKHRKLYKRLIECLTHNYTFKDRTSEFKNLFNDYVTTYKLLATKKELRYFEKKLEDYKSVKVSTSKSKFFLIALLGFLGIHKFIEKKYVVGILYLFTLGFFGVGIIIDLINDYAEYENDFQLDLIRYLISLSIVLFTLLTGCNNYIYFIIIAVLFTPIVYSKVLRIIPGLIKFIGIVVLAYFGFKTTPVINYVPTNAIGVWQTTNENTNFVEIDIKLDKTIIKFNDRDEEVGKNEYDNQNGILKIIVDEDTYYRFKLQLNDNKICVYSESQKCIIGFNKK